GADNIFAFYLGVHGDYGECMFPAQCRLGTPGQKADWLKRFGNLHNHYGYWCADELARAAFRRAMLGKYGGLDALNRAWGTAFSPESAIDYPRSVETRRAWLDFVRWYLDSMRDYAREVAKAANRHFPDTIKMFPLGAGDEDPRVGQDNTALVKMAAEERVQIRSTHGGFRPFAANASSQLARIATAAKFYGAAFWSEPPSQITPEGEVGRIFESICCGASGFWDWHANPVQPKAQEVFRQYRRLMVFDPPVVEVAVLFPQTYHYLQPKVPFPGLFLELGQELRDFVHFDIVDENLVADGALARYRYLIHLEGTVFEQSTVKKIAAWVEAGGVFSGLFSGNLETVERDATVPDWLQVDGAGGIRRLGRGAVAVCKGGRREKQAYFLRLKDVLYSNPPGKERRPVPAVDTDADGVYGVVLQSGRALLYNPSGQTKTKTVRGVRYDLPPASIVEVKQP
ncbi:MAG: family 14 glycosylhydrolase, partial [Thermoguttaceae bacterium]